MGGLSCPLRVARGLFKLCDMCAPSGIAPPLEQNARCENKTAQSRRQQPELSRMAVLTRHLAFTRGSTDPQGNQGLKQQRRDDALNAERPAST